MRNEHILCFFRILFPNPMHEAELRVLNDADEAPVNTLFGADARLISAASG